MLNCMSHFITWFDTSKLTQKDENSYDQGQCLREGEENSGDERIGEILLDFAIFEVQTKYYEFGSDYPIQTQK